MHVLHKREPTWLTLIPARGETPALRMLFAPITPAMRRRAQRAARRVMGDIETLKDADLDQLSDIGEEASRELIRLGALDWEGVGDEEEKPLELTPPIEVRFDTSSKPDRPTGTIDLFLADPDFFELADRAYVLPDGIRSLEKNGLSASRNGIGEAAMPGSATVSSPAGKKATRGARSAPTGRTSSKPKRANKSGKS